MQRKRRKTDSLLLRMFITPHGTEEYRLLEIEAKERAEAYEKKKAEIEVTSEQELPANSDFQQEILSLANQIVEKQNDLDKAIEELHVKLKALS